jgi:UDP-N-acetylglucosamine--N-acetylmuramyl-(pentapeptide) pyrophosphoryl-undecaprenol N-acetylglucosamine transferase
MKQQKPFKFMISGGGTGGHIFPALAIGKGLQKKFPDCEIEFVGAKGRMEMEKVVEAGFTIHGLWISGLQRKLTLENGTFPLKVLNSLYNAYLLLKKFKPNAVIGVGGYASGPLLYMASWLKIPTIIQEQNSYPGITNKLLGKRVDAILTAFDGPEKHLPANKITKLGNPVRVDILSNAITKKEALAFFNLNETSPVILIIGGSLGARTLNNCLDAGITKLEENGMQVIWQTGKSYMGNTAVSSGERTVFIKRMDMAYAAADIVISRAGALSLSELCIVGKPCILVPSPNVSEDHQTKNAMTLVNAGAAIMVTDKEASEKLIDQAIALIKDKSLQAQLSENIKNLAKPNATEMIVDKIAQLL